MRLTPIGPEVPENGGFTSDNDIFGYMPFGERLANLVRNIDEPLVHILDGKWGTGKSVFIKQWEGLLKSRGTTFIHFDAFENDFQDDPFIAIAAEIYTVADRMLGVDDAVTGKYLEKAKAVSKLMLPAIARITMRGVTAGLLSLDDVASAGSAVKEIVAATGDETSKAIDEAITGRLKKAGESRLALKAFRNTLKDLAQTIAEQQNADDGAIDPLVIVVDELDRCRPPFALGLIENIKHLFSVPGVCFVLVANLEHLEQTVRGEYGPAIDGRAYLEKFYHVRLNLPDPDAHASGRRYSSYFRYLWKNVEGDLMDNREGQLAIEILEHLGDVHNASFRRMERIVSNAVLAFAAMNDRTFFDAYLVACLSAMRQIDPDLYNQVTSGIIKWDDIRLFLNPKPEHTEPENLAPINYWKLAAGELVHEDFMKALRIEFGFSFRESKSEIIKFMAKYIESLDGFQNNITEKQG